MEESNRSRSNDDVIYTNPRQAIRCVRDSMRIVRGDTSSTPSPFFARAERLGLLFALNRKQALVYQRLEEEQTSIEEVPELAKLIQFLGFVTSGVVSETERVDAALLQTQEESIRVGREIKILDTKLQALKRTPQATLAERAIAERFPSRIIIRQSQAKKLSVKSAEFPENLKQEAESLAEQINFNRDYLAKLGDRIKVLIQLQNLMHGTHRLNGAMSNAEIVSLVDEISLISALRRSVHLIRDLAQSSSRVSPEEFEGIPALKILREFLQFVEAGIATLLDDLFRAQFRLKKAAAIEDITYETQKLHEQNERNKMEKQLAIENVSAALDATMFSASRGGGRLAITRSENQLNKTAAPIENYDEPPQEQSSEEVVFAVGRHAASNSNQQNRHPPLAPKSKPQQQQQPAAGQIMRRTRDNELESFLSEFCA